MLGDGKDSWIGFMITYFLVPGMVIKRGGDTQIQGLWDRHRHAERHAQIQRTDRERLPGPVFLLLIRVICEADRHRKHQMH